TDQFVYPIRMNTAINRGYRPGVLDTEGKLIRFASACSPWIYRGDAFPNHFKGDAFVCAPAANTIKRNLINDKELTVSGVNAYPDRDFLASTDERFRPVSLSGGPDGALYVVDMYRGIIQQADFMTPFLRRESERRKLEQPINLGRIYRIQSNSHEGSSLPVFSQLTPDQWAELLTHSNGWVRDKAQQWLVWKRPDTTIALLKNLANGSDSLAAIHALWALDGMGIDALELSLSLIDHPHDKIAIHARAIAARQAESDSSIKQLSAALSKNKTESVERTFHRVLALDEFDHEASDQPRLKIASQHNENPHIREALLSGLEKQELHFLDHLLHLSEWSSESSGKKLLIQELAAASLRGEGPIEVGHLFQLALGGSWHAAAIREGLLIALLERDKPLQFPKDPGIKDPRFQAYLQWPGHQPSTGNQESATGLSSKEKALFAKGQTIYGSLCASCHGANGEGMTMLAPPLVNSEWVTGHPDRLARILLHGLEGSIDVNGKTYQSPKILPAMPPVGMMSNDELAATMTYIRRAWNHSATPVTSRDIQRNRDLTAAQPGAYQVSELIDFSDN
ncbi:MAG: c-type cytochrome, partial [Opitutales bacterium]|nr:c-type cytochrome [Opitutales bacterium]